MEKKQNIRRKLISLLVLTQLLLSVFYPVVNYAVTVEKPVKITTNIPQTLEKSNDRQGDNLEQDDVNIQENEENDGITNRTINAVDYKRISDEKLTEAINATSNEELALFLRKLNEKETEELLKRDTPLIYPVSVANPVNQEDSGEDMVVMLPKEVERYYDYLMELEVKEQTTEIQPLAWGESDTSYAGRGNGIFYVAINKDNVRQTFITCKVNNVTSNNQTLSTSTVQVSPNNSGWVTTAVKIEKHLDASNQGWAGIVLEGRYNKPEHYYAIWEFDGDSSSSNYDPASGRFDTWTNSYDADTLSHIHGATTNSVRIQVNSMNCGLHRDENVHRKRSINLIKLKETLVINTNGGTYPGSTTISKECTQTTTISTPTRPGYRFNGWSVSHGAGASGTLNGNVYTHCISDGAWVSDSSSDPNKGRYTRQSATTTLTANWILDTTTVSGNITWNDSSNKYNSRVTPVIELYRDGTKINTVSATNNKYSFTNLPIYNQSAGKNYTYTIKEQTVAGYETTYSGYNVTNTLVLPTYTSQVSYVPIDTFKDQYLKNGKVKVTGVVTANSNNREQVGLYKGKATLQVDSGIQIDPNTVKVSYYEASTGTTTPITNYQISGNTITANYGKNSDGISQKGDKITFEVQGKMNKIGTYSTLISASGNLKDYRGTNTNINLGEVTKNTGNVTVQYQMPQAKLQIQKIDSITEKPLTDASFTLYEWNGTEYVKKEEMVDSNKDGIYESSYYEWNKLTTGKYKVEETKVPENHKDSGFSMEFTIDQLKAENYTITPDYDNENYRIAYKVNPDDFDRANGKIENEPFKLKVKINNIDSETKNQIKADATYKIYEWDNLANDYKEYISYLNGKEVLFNRQEDKTYLTNEWLYYTVQNEGKYKIVEETAPYGYYGDYDENKPKREYEINVLASIQTGDYEGQKVQNEGTINIFNNAEKTSIENRRVKNQININLIDSQTKTNIPQGNATLEGAVYGVYAKENIYHSDGITARYPDEAGLLYKKDELIQQQTTNEEGKLTFDDLECGIYYIKQITPPEGYLASSESQEVDVTYRGQEELKITEERTFSLNVKKQGFQIVKLQEDQDSVKKPLENAGFKMYLISDLEIVKSGKIVRNEDGTYTLADKEAQKDPYIVEKRNDNGSYNIGDLINYYYKIRYTEDNMEKLPQDEKAYYPYNINEETAKLYDNITQGENIQEKYTNKDGYLASPELPYGEYVIVETTVPHNLEPIIPFLVKVENDSRELQNLKYVLDENFTTRIKIYNKDIETKQTILKSGAKFVIQNKETGKLMTYKTWTAEDGNIEQGTYENPFETNRLGYTITPMELPVGKYRVIQVQAPDGYVKNGYEGHGENQELVMEPEEEIEFEIATNQIYYLDTVFDKNTIVIEEPNKQQVTSLKVTMKGEFLTKANKNENGNYQFTYEKGNVEGSVIGLYAKEDIYSQDNQKTIVYSKDQLVKQITTNADGVGYFDNIPIGNYYLKEIKAAEGFALNQQEIPITLVYGTNNKELEAGTPEWKEEAQTTPLLTMDQELEDTRQKVKISVTNNDQETNSPIQGTIIGIYAKQDIVAKDGTVIIKKDEVIETKTTNENGALSYEADLPLGEYYVKEITPAVGYIQNTNIYDADATYNEDQRALIEINISYTSKKTNVEISKVDEQKQILPGAKLEIVDENGSQLYSWISEEKGYTIRGLEINKTYTIKEQEAVSGYVTIEPITFQIKSNGDLQTNAETEGSRIYVVNNTTKLEIEVKDIQTGEKIQGAKFEIYKVTKNEDGTTKEEKVREFTTGEENYYTEKLPIGDYILRQPKDQKEELLDKGYATLEDISFKVEDTKETQKVEVKQDVTKLEIEVKDIQTGEKIQGAKFEIYKVTKNEDGTTKEEKVREFTTGEENYYTEKLPIGDYILRQPKDQKEELLDKGYATLEDISFKVEDTKETQKVEVKQDVTKLEIEVKDIQTGEKIQGAKFEIYKVTKNEDGTTKEEKVREFTTGEENYYTEKLPIGDYILRQPKDQKEELLDKGYATLEDISFKVEDTKETQKVEVKQDVTKLEIEVKDIQTGEKIQGAKFEIYKVTKNEDGTTKEEKVREFTTGEENYYTEKLPIGDYILRQPKDQKEELLDKGYATLEDISFKVEDTKETQKIEVEQDITKLEISLIDKDTKENIPGVKLEIYKVTTKEDGTTEEEKVGEFVTEEENYYIERLPVGDYILRQPEGQKEVLIDKGYVTLPDLSFKVEDTNEIQKLEVEQTVSKVEISLVDKDTKEQVPGSVLQIIKETTVINEETKEEETIREVIKEWTTTDKPEYIERLPEGDYILVQKEVDEDKGYVTTTELPFKVEDKDGVQEVEMVQAVTRLEIELKDKETQELIDGSVLQIIKQTKELNEETGIITTKEKVVKEVTTTKDGNVKIEKLPVGVYILRQTDKNILQQGYIRVKDLEFMLQNTTKIQKIILAQDYTKVEAQILDKKTNEKIIGATLAIEDENGKEITSWVSESTNKRIDRLPIGKYHLVEKEAPTDKGYVKTEKVPFEVEEVAHIQKVEMLQDYTKIKIEIVDEETGEEIPEGKVTITDEDGNVVAEVDLEDAQDVIEKLPVGDYTVEIKEPPYGYKPLKEKITVEDKQETQVFTIKMQREEFDLAVKEWVKEIKRNEKTEYTNKNQENKLRKIDIKDKYIRTDNIKITYTIQISNPGKIIGSVGKIEVNIPAGMKYEQKDNSENWKQENGKLVLQKTQQLKVGESKEINLTLRWKNGLENFGTKETVVEIKDITNELNYKEKTLENNKDKTQVIVGVGTGEMNLVYLCWILVAILIVIEIIISKKLKIKPFKIKDKTLK